jgi:tetratricopeptide (TPR) repeat protein
MFCSKCGENLADGTVFCTKCGNNVTGNNSAVSKKNVETPGMKFDTSDKIPKKYINIFGKKVPKKLTIIITIIVVVTIGVISIIPEEIELIKQTSALSNDETRVIAFLKKGIEYLGNGQYELAIGEFSQSINIDSNSRLSYSLRGRAYELFGRGDESNSDYEKAAQLDPNAERILRAEIGTQLLRKLGIPGY